MRSFDGYRGQLPSHLTSFIGRQAEMAAVSAELVTAQLVTLVGPGGIGKSRLATQLGAALVDKFPDGAWMFELAPLGRADGLEASMLATLGRSGTATTDPHHDLLETVHAWRALLILDNCEHLLRPAAELIRSVLRVAPTVTVLATSREPLHVDGERVVVLGPLSIGDDAVELFIDRARARRQSFDADKNRETVTRICQHLDGMPLAIELAAARTVAMTPTELEGRLDQRFRLLSDRPGTADDRHASLRRVVDWSYDLLDDDCRAFFLRLCVFAGSFDEQAAHRVCGGDDDLTTVDMLEDLVNKSLVVATPLGDRTSYQLLETMRQYGMARFAADEHASMRDRHDEYFAELAERSWNGMRSCASQDWLDLLDDEFDDIRAACERALSDQQTDRAVRITGGLFMYNHTRRLPEIYRWLEQALTLPGARSHRLGRHARLHWAYGVYMDRRLNDAEAEIQAVMADTPPSLDPLEPLAFMMLSAVQVALVRADEGAQLAMTAIERARVLGPDCDYDRAEAMWNLCTIALNRGSPDARLAADLLALARRLGNARAIAGGLLQLAAAEQDPNRGDELLAEARDLTARTRDTYRYALATSWRAYLHPSRNPHESLRMLPDLIKHARTTGQRLFVSQFRGWLPVFSMLGQNEAVAILDGATLPLTIRPALVATAISGARAALGDGHYEALVDKGKDFSSAQLEDYLLELAGDLE